MLGAPGLLTGRRATTHWAAHDWLAAFGAVPVEERVVRDRHLVTGGGVTAGIDYALTLAAELTDAATAQAIQLQHEYAPAPPFAAGRPEIAGPTVTAAARARLAASRAERAAIVARVVSKRAQSD